MDASMLKWKPGFGPVLKPKDLYLLEANLEIHPILKQTFDGFRMELNLATGQTVGFNAGDRAHELAFTMKDETATLPRITELMIITSSSPWCTIVRNERGVTLADVCGTLWKDYTENPLTEAEFAELSPREQDRVQRVALRRESDGYASALSGTWGVGSNMPHGRCRRIDRLHGKVFFNGLERDDEFAKRRLGFAASNVFKLTVSE